MLTWNKDTNKPTLSLAAQFSGGLQIGSRSDAITPNQLLLSEQTRQI